jgi:DNA polymerase III delta subunit
MMLRQFRLIFRVKACFQAGMTKGQIAGLLVQAPFLVEKMAAQGQQYSFGELEKAMGIFLAQDLAMKSSVPLAQVLEDLVISLAS